MPRKASHTNALPPFYYWRKFWRWIIPYKLRSSFRRYINKIMPQFLRWFVYRWYTTRKLRKYLPWSPQKKHTIVIGGSWSGKSTAITFLWYHHIDRTNKPNKKGKYPLAFSLIEPHSDLSMDYLQFGLWKGMNRERLIYLDADIRTTYYKLFWKDIGHHDFVINPFEVTTNNANDHNAMVENLTSAIFSVVRSRATERMENIIEAWVDLLLKTPWASIVDLKDIMDDVSNEKRVNKWVNMKNVERAEIFRNLRENKDIDSAKNGVYYRLKRVLSSPMIRSKLVWKSTINMEEAINDWKVLIFNIWSMWARSGSVYGRLMLALQQWIISKRLSLNKYGRKPFLSYVDEASEYLSSAEVINNVLTKQRKFGHHMLLAFQTIAQVGDMTLKDVIMGNTALKVFARLDSKSKSKMKATIAELTKEDFENIPKHTFLVHNHENQKTKSWRVPDMLVRKNKPFFLDKQELKELLDWTIFESWYYHPIDPETGYPEEKKSDDKTNGWIDEHTGKYMPNFKN